MRVWLDPERLAEPQPRRRATSSQALREQNVQVASGVDRPAAGARRARVPAPRDHARPAARRRSSSRTSSSRRGADGRITRVRDVGAHRARRARLRRQQLPRQPAGGGDGDRAAPGLERARDRRRGRADDGGAVEGLSRGHRVPDRLQPDRLRRRVDRRGDRHALRGGRARRARRAGVPAELAREPDPARSPSRCRWSARSRRWRRSASRSTCCRSSASCWRSASSSTTRSSWSRTSSATSRPGCRRARRRDKAMDEVTRRGHRDRLRPVGGVRADRVPRRHRRAVLPPVRAHDRRRRRCSRRSTRSRSSPALCALLLQPHGAAEGLVRAAVGPRLRPLLRRVQPRLRRASAEAMRGVGRLARAPAAGRPRRLRGARRARRRRLLRGFRPASSRRRTRAT